MTIAQCDYCIRKGQEPKPDRSNIFPWGMVKERDDEFEVYAGVLPKLAVVVAEPEKARPSNAPTLEKELERVAIERKTQIMTAFEHLRPEDFKVKDGLPLVAAVQTLSGVAELTASDMKALWEEFTEERKKKG